MVSIVFKTKCPVLNYVHFTDRQCCCKMSLKFVNYSYRIFNLTLELRLRSYLVSDPISLNPYMVFLAWNHGKKIKKESNSIVGLYC